MACIGTTSGERRKEFGKQFILLAIVTFLGFWVFTPLMSMVKATGVACLISFVFNVGQVGITQSSRMSYFRGLGYGYPRMLWEYFFGRKPFGDKTNHNGKVEPLQF
jgi:hypothetical protein